MPEWIPVILSVCFGGGLWPTPHALFRIASAIVGTVLLASLAFVASGECYITWTYFLIDLAQAVLGFAAGAIAAHFIVHRARGVGANCLSVAPAHSRNRCAWKCAATNGFQELGLPAGSYRKRF